MWRPFLGRLDSEKVPCHQTLGQKLDIGTGIYLRRITKTNEIADDNLYFQAQIQALQHLRELLLRQLNHVSQTLSQSKHRKFINAINPGRQHNRVSQILAAISIAIRSFPAQHV